MEDNGSPVSVVTLGVELDDSPPSARRSTLPVAVLLEGGEAVPAAAVVGEGEAAEGEEPAIAVRLLRRFWG